MYVLGANSQIIGRAMAPLSTTSMLLPDQWVQGVFSRDEHDNCQPEEGGESLSKLVDGGLVASPQRLPDGVRRHEAPPDGGQQEADVQQVVT